MFDLPTLLPPNAQKVEYDFEQLSARLQGMADPVQALWDAEICPEHLLPWLAWALSVEIWDSEWTVLEKRQALAAAIGVHRLKGTPRGIKTALAAIGYAADLVEWFQAEGTAAGMAPHEFGIVLDVLENADNPAKIAQALRVLKATKPVRSHLVSVQMKAGALVGPVVAAVATLGHEIRVRYVGPPMVANPLAIVLTPSATLSELAAVLTPTAQLSETTIAVS